MENKRLFVFASIGAFSILITDITTFTIIDYIAIDNEQISSTSDIVNVTRHGIPVIGYLTVGVTIAALPPIIRILPMLPLAGFIFAIIREGYSTLNILFPLDWVLLSMGGLLFMYGIEPLGTAVILFFAMSYIGGRHMYQVIISSFQRVS